MRPSNGARPSRQTLVRGLAAVAGAAVVLSISPITPSAGAAESMITIADAAFAECLAAELSVEGGRTFSTDRLASVESLRCGGLSAESVGGLAGANHLTGLTELSLLDSTVSDLRPLAGLTKLERLSVQSSRLSDLSPLASLTQLDSLSLESPQLTDLSPLTSLRELAELRAVAPLTSLTGVGGLSRLTTLSITSSPLTDLGPVAKLTGLRQLSLATPLLGSLAPLAALTQLTYLSVETDLAASLDPLAGMSGLASLRLSAPAVSDLTPLGRLGQLAFLSVTDSQVADLTPLEAMTNLTELYFERNQAKDLAPLSGLTSLSVLGLDDNLIADPSPLAALTQLDSVSLAGNQIDSVAPLRPLTDYYWLDLSGNQITDLSPLNVPAGKDENRRLKADHQVIHLPLELGSTASLNLKSLDGSAPALTPSAGVTVSSGKVTVSQAGAHTVTFTSGDLETDGYSYSGTVMVGANVIVPSVPTITGDVAVGSVLSAKAGKWSPAPVTLAYQWLSGGVAVPEATGSTYTVREADLGKQLSVRVSGSKSGYEDVASTSAETAPAASAVLAPSDTPTISGSALVGSTLKASAGNWDPNASLAYQWLRAGKPVTGATSASYSVGKADVGSTLQVSVTGSRAGYASVTRSSVRTAVVPALSKFTKSPTPTLAGKAKVGSPLSVKVGTWSPSPARFTYQWLRSGRAITAATAARYILSAEDAGKTVAVKVTVSRPGIQALSRTSKPSAKVAAGSLSVATPRTSTTKPVVDGVITAKTAAWGPGTVKLAYQWYRVSASGKSKAISGAKSVSYRVSASRVGYRLKVKVTGSRSGYVTASKYSKTTTAVAKATFVTGTSPSIAVDGGGTPRVGKVLTARAGTYTPSAAISYQWYRGSRKIGKATAKTYRLASADFGKSIKVRVSAKRSGYVSQTGYGRLGVSVKAGISAVVPRITDTTPRVGQTISITSATSAERWSPAVNPTYRWLRDGKAISGASAANYLVQDADAGKRISVRVVGRASDYAPVTKTSASTSRTAKA